jgi:hypothetical protein
MSPLGEVVQILSTTYPDLTGDNVCRLVMREHTNGYSRTLLQRPMGEPAWETVEHMERLFKEDE